jgi:DNA-directed RNA polymerase subunit RPC12/RpoP
MIRENMKCPRCGAITDLYRGSGDSSILYYCLPCWSERRREKDTDDRRNGRSHMAYAKFKRRVRT